MQFAKKDILDMASLSADEINLILDTADGMKEISTRPNARCAKARGGKPTARRSGEVLR